MSISIFMTRKLRLHYWCPPCAGSLPIPVSLVVLQTPHLSLDQLTALFDVTVSARLVENYKNKVLQPRERLSVTPGTGGRLLLASTTLEVIFLDMKLCQGFPFLQGGNLVPLAIPFSPAVSQGCQGTPVPGYQHVSAPRQRGTNWVSGWCDGFMVGYH